MEIWIEKYRPEKVSDVAGQKETVKMLEGFIKSGEMPHLIFAGPPGGNRLYSENQGSGSQQTSEGRPAIIYGIEQQGC